MALLLLALIELVMSSWLSDDALITARSVLNFIHGYGPTFNLSERVQSFTHPLWFLLLSFLTWLTNNPIASIQHLSLGLSVATILFFCKRFFSNHITFYLSLSSLIFSKAFIDFSSSGLENPLSYLLLLFIASWGVLARKGVSFIKLTTYIFLCALLCITRLDLILLIFPLTCYVLWAYRAHLGMIWRALLIGGSPFILWTLFSLYYYGFPFPNTAYAKLGNVPFGGSREIIYQGLRYFENSFLWDPITLVTIFIGILVGAKVGAWQRSIALGVFSYLIYIVVIGGDFMSGRFFTSPLLLAALLVTTWQPLMRMKKILILIYALCIGFGLYLNFTSLFGLKMPSQNWHGIADERTYYQDTLALAKTATENQTWKVGDYSVVLLECGQLGMVSILKGPGAHLIDQCGLADPLLARLPFIPLGAWRIGHFIRMMPAGYLASVQNNSNLLSNVDLRAYYAMLQTVTRGSLSSMERLKTVLQMNLGLAPRPNLTYLYDVSLTAPSINEFISIGTHSKNQFSPPKEFGWFYNEQGEIWAENFRSMLLLPSIPKGARLVELRTLAWIHPRHPSQDVRIFINGKFIKEVSLNSAADNLISINDQEIEDKNSYMSVEFQFLNAKRPKELGIGNEARLMTMGLQGITYR
jgi:arabinofuranosyltransferase